MSIYDNYTALTVDIKERIATVTLSRPKQLNALDHGLHVELTRVMDDLAEDNNARVVVLTGAGRAFSSGGDINFMRDKVQNPDKVANNSIPECIKLVSNIVDLPKPSIAVVNGPAMGLGATIAMACDIVFAAEDALIADPHISVGLAAGDGGCLFWPMEMGLHKAKEFLMTGDPMTGRQLADLGAINRALPSDQLMPEAMKLARRFAEGPTMALLHTKMSANLLLKQQMNLVLQCSLAMEYLGMINKDYKEGVTAFLEKRKPKYAGELIY